MNKKLALAVFVVAVLGLFTFVGAQSKRAPQLQICTWSNYFSEEMIAAFTKETGIQVNLAYISSNEELFAKLKAGATGFDIIQPSDYMVRQMIALKMLHPIDAAILPNMSHLDDFYRNLPYDPGLKFSVPYVRGITGLTINTQKVAVPEDGVSWELLFNSPDPKHTSALDDMREVFAAALLSKGNDLNSMQEADLAAGQKEIAKLRNSISMFTSEPLVHLEREEVTIAHSFSTHGVLIEQTQPHIKFFIPKEGAVVWTDNFAIPASAKQPKEAHRFIEFFLRPENALVAAQYNRLATPNRTARLRLPASEQQKLVVYPDDATLKRLHFLRDLGPVQLLMDRMWTEVRS